MESAYSVGDPSSIPGLRRSPREGNGNLLHYFYLKNPVDGEPGRLWSMELQRFRHDWMNNTTLYIHICICTFIYGCVHIYTHNLFIIFHYILLQVIEYSSNKSLLLVSFIYVHFSSLQPFSSVWLFVTPGLHHTRPPSPSPTPRVYLNSCSLSRWCHPTISFSVIPFSSHLQSFPPSGSFPMSKFFSGGQSIGVSALASVLPMNIHYWFPLGWTGWISLQSKGLSRVFSNTTVQKHQFFSAQLSL